MGSRGEPSFDTSGMTEVLFEDIQDLSVSGGLFRCTLYSYRLVRGFAEPCWVPVLPIAMPVGNVAPVAYKALRACGVEAIRITKEFVQERVPLLPH